MAEKPEPADVDVDQLLRDAARHNTNHANEATRGSVLRGAPNAVRRVVETFGRDRSRIVLPGGEEALDMGVSYDAEDQAVYVVYERPIAWQALRPAAAWQLAEHLRAAAIEANGGRPPV